MDLQVTSGSHIKEQPRKSIDETVTDEVVFALCGLIGSPLDEMGQQISNLMIKRGYEVIPFKVSDIIEELSGAPKPKNETGIQRKNRLITLGNRYREKYGNDILVKDVIGKIYKKRTTTEEWRRGDRTEVRKICYVINSLKHPEEKELLEKVYGDLFYLIGVYSHEIHRKNNLSEGDDDVQVQDLINRDYDEVALLDNGQAMKKLFHKADFFANLDNPLHDVSNSFNRFLDALFLTSIVTPTFHEKAMYAAWSSALNSACLSRQVGAAITDYEGDIIGLGWNDVPKAGGGVYGGDSDPKTDDNRCAFLSGAKCFNDFEKNIIANDLSILLKKSGIIKSGQEKDTSKALRGSDEISNLIEFSRAIHAEMLALFNALKFSPNKVKGGKAYVTTYPCHNCARHIILSGVTHVYFIEPYPKSKASKLHFDSWQDEEQTGSGVIVEPFQGIAPNRYDALFSRSNTKVKDQGHLKLDTTRTARHRFGVTLAAIHELERTVTTEYSEKAGTTTNEQETQKSRQESNGAPPPDSA